MWDGDNHMNGGWWWVMGIGWLLFLAFIGFLVYLLVRHHTETGNVGKQGSTAEQLLAERLARGEIDEDEYRRRRDALRS
jgi:putative membrane protein